MSSTQGLQGNPDAPVTSTGNRGRPPADAVEHLQGPAFVPDKRCKRDAVCVAFVADKEVVKERAQWRNPELRPRVEAPRWAESAAGRVEAAISAWVADKCNRVPGQVSSNEEEAAHADLLREAGRRGPDAWGTFGVLNR